MTKLHSNIVRARRRRAGDRRGVALLLAMCAVATASIVTATYVASRENSPSIGENAIASISAKWAGESAGDLAVAALETGLDPADLEDPSKFMDGLTLAGATVNVVVTDAEGNAPEADSSQLIVTITATKDGVTSTAQRVVERTPPSMTLDQAIDPEMGEFALYTKQSVIIEAGGALIPWSLSPGFGVTSSMAMGVGFASDASFSVNAGAGIALCKLFTGPNANATLQNQTKSAKFTGGAVLPVSIPFVRSAIPAAAQGLTLRSLLALSVNSTRGLNAGLYQDMTCEGAVSVTLSGSYSFSDLRVRNSAILRISGNVIIVCRDDLEFENFASVEFVDANAKVTFLVADDVLIDDCALGVSNTISKNSSRTVSSVVYQDTNRLRIIALNSASGGTGDQTVTLVDKSLVVGKVFAPSSAVDIGAGSGVIGHVISGTCRVRAGGSILYDLALNKGFGFSNTSGPLYKKDGTAVSGLVDALATITEAVTDVLGLNTLLATLSVSSGGADEEEEGDEPTPRSTDYATDRKWPAQAMALEQVASGDDDSDGKGLLVDVGALAEDVE